MQLPDEMDAPYVPIDCNYYDELLTAAMRETPVRTVYLDAFGQMAETSSSITDVYTKDGAEFMHLANGLVLRLDSLLEVDGKRPPRNPGACAVGPGRH